VPNHSVGSAPSLIPAAHNACAIFGDMRLERLAPASYAEQSQGPRRYGQALHRVAGSGPSLILREFRLASAASFPPSAPSIGWMRTTRWASLAWELQRLQAQSVRLARSSGIFVRSCNARESGLRRDYRSPSVQLGFSLWPPLRETGYFESWLFFLLGRPSRF
jgi:hypothetical protein